MGLLASPAMRPCRTSHMRVARGLAVSSQKDQKGSPIWITPKPNNADAAVTATIAVIMSRILCTLPAATYTANRTPAPSPIDTMRSGSNVSVAA